PDFRSPAQSPAPPASSALSTMSQATGSKQDSPKAFYRQSVFETTLAATRHTIKLNKLEPLTGQENYTIWAATMKHIFKSHKLASIVIYGASTSANATSSEKAAFEELCEEANTLMIQVVSSNILKTIVTMDSPH